MQKPTKPVGYHTLYLNTTIKNVKFFRIQFLTTLLDKLSTLLLYQHDGVPRSYRREILSLDRANEEKAKLQAVHEKEKYDLKSICEKEKADLVDNFNQEKLDIEATYIAKKSATQFENIQEICSLKEAHGKKNNRS